MEYHQDQLDIIGPVGLAFGISQVCLYSIRCHEYHVMLLQVLGIVVCISYIIVLFFSKDSYNTSY